MKRTKLILITLLTVLLTSIIVGFTANRKSKPPLTEIVMTAQRTPKKLIIRDFPADGITIHHMNDPKYQHEAEYMFQSPPKYREATNQYSFVVENTSNKAVVELSLIWGFPKPGQTTYQTSSIRTTSANHTFSGPFAESVIKAGGKTGYCFALGLANLDHRQPIRQIHLKSPFDDKVDPRMDEAIESQFASLDRLLEASDHWVVEIEGLFFEDGTFIGTNSKHFFEMVEGRTNGSREMIDNLAEKIKNQEPYASWLDYAQKYANITGKDLQAPFQGSSFDMYNNPVYAFQLGKTLIAKQIAGIGEQQAIKFITRQKQNYIKLVKKTHTD